MPCSPASTSCAGSALKSVPSISPPSRVMTPIFLSMYFSSRRSALEQIELVVLLQHLGVAGRRERTELHRLGHDRGGHVGKPDEAHALLQVHLAPFLDDGEVLVVDRQAHARPGLRFIGRLPRRRASSHHQNGDAQEKGIRKDEKAPVYSSLICTECLSTIGNPPCR